jgi:hypothetical protein
MVRDKITNRKRTELYYLMEREIKELGIFGGNSNTRTLDGINVEHKE